MKIERRNILPAEEFVTHYLAANNPVIVVDAMSGWKRDRWQPDYLKQKLGGCEVQIYNNHFDLLNVDTLANYLQDNFNHPERAACNEYVRWYTKFKDMDFAWADEAFAGMRQEWAHPCFLPVSSYAVPFCPSTQVLDVTGGNFPYMGIFVSAAGARTRLHQDPWNSDAVLCQFYGRKSLTLYAPDQGRYLQNDGECIDPQEPDHARFPHFRQARPDYQDVLETDEILYIPGGWFHDVTSLSDSVSVTWNFLHSARLSALGSYLRQNPADVQIDVIRYFLRQELGPDATGETIIQFLEKHFGQAAASMQRAG